MKQGIVVLVACAGVLASWAALAAVLGKTAALALSGLSSGKDNVGGAGLIGAIGAAAAAAMGALSGEGGRGASRINSASPGVRVGHDGDWHGATPGMQLGDRDFVRIPPGDIVSVTLPDGSSREFTGRSIISGSSLNGTSPGTAIWGSETTQAVVSFIVGDTTRTKGNGGGKA